MKCEHLNHFQKKSGKTKKTVARLKAAPLLFFLLLPSLIMSVSADMGMIPVLPDVSIYEPGQKAIVAWNGQEEILVLSTDVSSTVNTTALQILPLPSNPKKIEEASLKSFNVIQELIWSRMPPPPPPYPWTYFGNETNEVIVVFHEKIGMHNITVVEAHNVSEFAKWMGQFLLNNGINQQVSLQNFESIIGDYILRDFHFYVLDLVDLSSLQKSVEPILYEFDTKSLYYPLLITSPIGGHGRIVLFLITEDVIETGFYPLSKAKYYFIDFSQPIEFEMSHEELSLIDPRIEELFKDKAFLTALIYEGPLDKLTKDMVLTMITGDLNFDGKVDIIDIVTAAKAFGSSPGHSRWNSAADMNKDNTVNIQDMVLIARNFGK